MNEIRLGGGQLARMTDGGTLKVIESASPMENKDYYFRMTVTHKDDIGKPRPLNIKPTQASCANYDTLIAFLKQLENLDYVMTNLERVPGEISFR